MFTIGSTEELEVVREKVSRRDLDFNEIELQCLTQVYKEIGQHYGLRYTLNKSCSSCIKEAMNIVYNYINFHEPKKTTVLREAKVTVIKPTLTESDSVADLEGAPRPDNPTEEALNEMTLPELREAYPDIKKRSKTDFIKAVLNDNKEE